MSIKQKIGAAIALGSLAASVIAPGAAFAATIKIKNNGFGSHNGVAEIKFNKKVVAQGNFTAAGTFVGAASNTGGNNANGNTGNGAVSVQTGNATTTTTVTVSGGNNTNTGGESCCCDGENTDVEITGNGSFSHNGALVVSVCKDIVLQGTATVAHTGVFAASNTGGNNANGNTGGGDVTVDTGNATTTTTVTVTGGSNTNN